MKKFYKKLVVSINRKSGRNNKGRICVRRKGGGHKRLYRKIDFKFRSNNYNILRIEYDPNRNFLIALVFDLESNKLKYIILSQDMYKNFMYEKNNQFKDLVDNKEEFDKEFTLEKFSGVSKTLLDIPIGFSLYNVEFYPGQGGIVARSAGTFCKILSKNFDKGYASLLMPSGEIKLFNLNCNASLGKVYSNPKKNKRKAGDSRHCNKRPSVRGVAMNPVDHPHGGGEGKTSGGRCSVTPWGVITKGKRTRCRKNKTNFYIIKRRN